MSFREEVKDAVREVLREERASMNAPAPDPLQYLTTDDVASLLGFDEATVREAMAKGKLPGEKVLGRWRVRRVELERFLAGMKAPASLPTSEQRNLVDAAAANLAAEMTGKKKAG